MVLHSRFRNPRLLGLVLALAAPPLACSSPTSPDGQPEEAGFRSSPQEPGFRSIFDGATLAGWEGNQSYWRAENGVLIGEITPTTVVRSNTFVVWRGGRPGDFELKLEYRISADGNSGINYRSTIVPDTITPDNRFAMRGYQCDIDGRQLYTGNNYEEKGRLFLALRGQKTRVVGGAPPILLSTLGESSRLASYITEGWNAVHLTVRGNEFTHTINDHLMSVVIDDDVANRPVDGLIGMQVHVGPPMKVEYRNIQLKN